MLAHTLDLFNVLNVQLFAEKRKNYFKIEYELLNDNLV